MTTRKEVAEKLFPDVTDTIADLQLKYPARPELFVGRIAPSPTGFLHI
jgi:glutamyl/glutaminyl-tRNA synthetase